MKKNSEVEGVMDGGWYDKLIRERDEARDEVERLLDERRPDETDPNGWIRRSALNEWYNRACKAESEVSHWRDAAREIGASDGHAMALNFRDLRAEVERIHDAAEMLWVVLANVSGGDWSKQSDDWQEAARRWSDHYHKVTKHRRDKIRGVPNDRAERKG